MNLEPLITLIQKHSLEKHQQAILATVRPSIHIYLANQGQGNIGQSRIGGYPDLPASLPWPKDPRLGKPLVFIMQINFAELPDFTDNPLPKQGMLYLFLDDNENHAQQLVIYAGNEPWQPTQLPNDTEFSADYYEDLVVHTLSFELLPDIPRWATNDFEELAEHITAQVDGELEVDGEEVLSDLTEELSGYLGKLLGHVSGIGYDPREDAYGVRDIHPEWLHKDNEQRKTTKDLSKAILWQNLLELQGDDDVNLMIGDVGYVQILIHDNDLKNKDFSRVYVSLQSH